MTIEELNAEIEKQTAAVEEAAALRDAARDKRDDLRVAAMTPELVQKAKDLGINPRNFEDDSHLQEAINICEAEAPVAAPTPEETV